MWQYFVRLWQKFVRWWQTTNEQVVQLVVEMFVSGVVQHVVQLVRVVDAGF